MMKKITLQNRILSGVLAFAILLSLLPVRTLGTEFVTENPVPASAPAAPRITREGEPIQSISLASYERIEIVAESAVSNALFQWQILHPEKSDVWINIYDATHSYLFVTLALVRNMLKPDQTTQLRCRIVAGEQMQYTEPVFVQYCPELVYSPPSTVTEPTAPVETVAETVPMETTEATVPAETEQPTVPAETVAETVPAETTEATMPAETEQPTVPAETMPETAPMETTEATMPAETEQPTVPAETMPETAPVETTEATVPAETEQPTVPAETVPETVPAETTEATVPAETEQPTVLTETVPETVPMETTEATMPAETEQPTVPAETVPETVPAETTEATVPAETEQPTVPAETVPETAPMETTEATVPAETEQPTVPAETVAETAPMETTEATVPAETEQPTVPAETVAETAPMETTEAAVPAETEQPTVPAEKVPEAASGKMKDVAAPEETVPVTEPEAGETDPAPGQSDAERLWEEWILPALFTEEMYLDLQPVKDVASDEETGGSEFVNVTIDYVRYDFARDSAGKLIPEHQNNGQQAPVYHGGYLLEEEGTVAFTSYRATLQSGTDLHTTVPVPTLVGYQSYLENGTDVVTQVEIDRTNITEDVRITVKYKPAQVKYTVRYYFQNIYDDLYAENTGMKIESQGFTGAMPVEAHLNPGPDTVDAVYPGKTEDERAQLKEMLRGFTSLYYQPDFIAADGSTVFEVYLERNYYLMEFDCNGGYGTDTLYNRYGSYISVPNPMLSGWQFNGWDLVSTEESGQKEKTENGTPDSLPTEMPPYNTAYKAIWGTANTTYTVAYWIQNEDGSKSYIGSHRESGLSGTRVSGQDDLDTETGAICGYAGHTHTAACYTCGHIHTEECISGLGFSQPGYSEGDMNAMKAIGDEDPVSGYLYTLDVSGDGKTYYKLKIGETWYGFDLYQTVSPYISGDPIGEATIEWNGRTYNAKKYNITGLNCNHTHDNGCWRDCGFDGHTHTDDCYQNTRHIQFHHADQNVLIEGDGSTVVNVYYEYKTYTLKFYYAASEVNNGATVYKIVGGSTYHFGEDGPDSFDDAALLDNMFGNQSRQCGQVDALPTLNSIGQSKEYTPGTLTSNGRTYYYISFQARYGDDISQKWPCGVFNSATRTSPNNSGWTATEAFVSAWNGENFVRYSQRNTNETIKGVYEILDDDILIDERYEDQLEVSYLCFWENGAEISWSVPELYVYNIWLPCIDNKKENAPAGKTTKQEDNIWYYLETSYDTCDDSTINEQTFPAITGFTTVKKTWAVYFMQTDKRVESAEYTAYVAQYGTPENAQPYEYYLGDDKKYGPDWFNENFCDHVYSGSWNYAKTLTVKETTGTYSHLLYDAAVYNPDTEKTANDLLDHTKFREAYAVDFFYKRNEHRLIFWNHNDYLFEGGQGAVVQFDKNLGVYGQFVNENRMNNGWTDQDTQQVVDPYPTTLEPNAYEFTGWYTTENCLPGTEMDWNTMTMPDNDMTVYAKWEPVKRNVTFYTLFEDIGKEEGDEGYDENLMPFQEAKNVPHGSTLGTAYNNNPAEVLENGTLKDPRIEGYTFIGWFYMDEDNKKRFAPDSMEVNRDLILFAEWKTEIDTTYEVHYVLQDAVTENGMNYAAGTPVAPSIYAHASVGKTQTFNAKGKQELYSPFQSKFFPRVNSHSILMTEEPQNNTFTFEYLYDDSVLYKIRYLEAGTNKPLHDEVPRSTDASVVTEKFLPIPEYLPQSYYIRKTLAYDGPATEAIEENIITFYYVRDTAHGIYSVEYYLENVDGTYTQYETIVGTDDLKDEQNNPKVFTAEVRQYEGYEPRPEKFEVITYDKDGKVEQTKTGTEAGNPPSGTISENGLTIKLYYSRKSYSYTVEYWLAGSDIEDPKQNGLLEMAVSDGSAKFDSRVTWSLVGENRDDTSFTDSAGNIYEFVPSSPDKATQEQTKSITIRANVSENRIIFFYEKKEVEIFYNVVCTDPALSAKCGAVSLASERAANLSGSKAIPKTGFIFKGWYKDAACTTPVETGWVKENHLIPLERYPNTGDTDEANDWINRYYALFEPVRKPLTITKEGQNLSAEDSFLFRITGVGTDAIGQTIDLTVAIQGSGFVTIPGLYCGTYQVRELTNWSWAYENTNGVERTVTITTAENPDSYTVTFTNEAKTEKDYLWLHGESSVDNRFDAVA